VTAPPRWPGVLAGRVFSVLVAVAALFCGVSAIVKEFPVAASPARSVFSPELRAQVRAVKARLPPGASVLYVPARQEAWFSRLWQRALYPDFRTIVVQPWDISKLPAWRAKYGARFAITAGNPPHDIAFVWKIDLGVVPGLQGTTWFGELAP
jgi:hypothetical protein